jgi:hypothetical protein
VRPFVRPAVSAVAATFAPAAAPLLAAVLNPQRSADQVLDDPVGYFPSPHPKLDLAMFQHDRMLQSAGLWSPSWYRDLAGQAEIAGGQVGRRIVRSYPEFFDEDEDDYDEEDFE